MNDLRLTAAEFHTLWTELGLGDPPYPVDVPEPAEPADTRDLRRAVEPWLRLLDEHTVAVDLVADCAGPVRALAASNGRGAVLAEVTADGVHLTPIRPTGLVHALLSLLPGHHPGPGHSLSVPLDRLRQAAQLADGGPDEDDYEMPWGAGGGSLDERSALVQAGISPNDAALLSELTSSRVAGGQFGVSYEDGGRRRHPGVVTWFDTAQGRYLMVRDGAWLSIAPADQSRLSARVGQLLASAA
jgi:ESX secretion-associated protein EspG